MYSEEKYKMEVDLLHHKTKSHWVSNIKQKEDKYSRFDYSKNNADLVSGIIGVEGNMKDCR